MVARDDVFSDYCKLGAFENPRILKITPWKFKIAPEILPSQKEGSLRRTIIFQGLC